METTMATATRTPESSPRTAASTERLKASSPTKMTRIQEKAELQHLNDRLATYIEKVKSLEEQNTKLTTEVTTTRITYEKEVESVKSMYEAELADARRLLDDTAKDKAREQIENRKNTAMADEYKKKLDKEVIAQKKASDELKGVRKRLSDKESQLVALNDEVKHVEGMVVELKKECQDLRDSLESAKYALEQETLTRVDLENKLQSKEEELNFKKEMYHKDMQEIRAQLKSVETKHLKIEADYRYEYEGLVVEKLQELREVYENEAKQYRDETDNLYSAKYLELQEMSDKDCEELRTIREEKRMLSMTVENMKSEMTQVQAKNDSLALRIEDLEKLRASDQRRADEAICSRDTQIRELRKKIEAALKEYEELMGVKTALDLEILTYRKMLEGEETRLKISPPSSPVFGESHSSSAKSRSRSVKRIRTDEEKTKYTAEGFIKFAEASSDGTFIKLFNSGPTDVSLGGWTLERAVGSSPPVVYKFTPKYVLKSGSYVTVWASEGGGHHKPPANLVFKQQPSWGVGKETRTVLRDPDCKELATVTEVEVHSSEHRSWSDEMDSGRLQGRREGETSKGCLVQ